MSALDSLLLPGKSQSQLYGTPEEETLEAEAWTKAIANKTTTRTKPGRKEENN
jgi:hypothetical protein